MGHHTWGFFFTPQLHKCSLHGVRQLGHAGSWPWCCLLHVYSLEALFLFFAACVFVLACCACCCWPGLSLGCFCGCRLRWPVARLLPTAAAAARAAVLLLLLLLFFCGR